MNGQFVLFSGSASASCPAERMDQAVQFLDSMVPQVLQAGGGLVVLLGDEDSTKGDDGKPCIFDWTIMRAVERYAEFTTEPPRTYIRVVMSDTAWFSKMSEGNRKSFANLQQRGVLEAERIRREEYTGGKYRRLECELADALVAMGGGKGTYSVGREMLDMGKPVLPLDLEIGAYSEDGDGALLLHKELQEDPSLFFPATHRQVGNLIEAASLRSGRVDGAARRAAEILKRELESGRTDHRGSVKRWFRWVGAMANQIPTVGWVLRIIEFFR